jgi:hypothetical protein
LIILSKEVFFSDLFPNRENNSLMHEYRIDHLYEELGRDEYNMLKHSGFMRNEYLFPLDIEIRITSTEPLGNSFFNDETNYFLFLETI